MVETIEERKLYVVYFPDIGKYLHKDQGGRHTCDPKLMDFVGLDSKTWQKEGMAENFCENYWYHRTRTSWGSTWKNLGKPVVREIKIRSEIMVMK